jgi:cytochrome c553
VKKALFAAVAVSGILSGAAWAADAEAPRLVRDICSKCHGPEGISQSPLFPRLAGQQVDYLDAQMHQFRDRSRGDPHAQAYMWGIAGPLTDGQIQKLAQYFAERKPVHGAPPSDPELAVKGKSIFFEGVPDHEIPVCAGCHGEHAEGQGAIPRLAGQHFDYLYRQLRDFRSELRSNEIMHANVMKMSDDEAAAVSAYLASQ